MSNLRERIEATKEYRSSPLGRISSDYETRTLLLANQLAIMEALEELLSSRPQRRPTDEEKQAFYAKQEKITPDRIRRAGER